MLDFKITDSGDLAFSDDIITEEMTIRFVTAKHPSFLLRFWTTFAEQNIKPEGFTISFDTNKKLFLTDKFASANKDTEIAQAIRIRVRTELSELRNNLAIGSTLLLYKHKKIDENLLDQIESAITNIVAEVTEEEGYSVKVVQEIGSGNFYCQNITVYIYRDNELVYQFEW